VHQAGDRADQTEKWCDAGDHFEDDETLLQPHHFVTRACFNHFHILRTRPAQMLERNARDSGQ
jgi:hypothetical protein